MKHLERALDGKNKWWKLPATILTMLIGATIFATPIAIIDLIIEGTAPEYIKRSNNSEIFKLLAVFLCLFYAFVLSIRIFYNRRLPEIINGTKKIRWKRIGIGIFLWGSIMTVSIILQLILSPNDYTFQFEPGKWFILLLLVLFLMPFQTSVEELFFRGYLSQTIGGWTRNRWVVLIVTSVLFGALHYSNPEVEEYGALIMLPQYIITGLLFGLIAILDDGIELPLGIHFINNALGSLLITFEASALKSDALFVVRNINPVGSLIELLITSTITIFILHRIYKWDFRILNKRIENEDTHSNYTNQTPNAPANLLETQIID